MDNRKETKLKLIGMKMAPELVEAVDLLASRQFTSRTEVIRRAMLKDLEAAGICPVRPVAA